MFSFGSDYKDSKFANDKSGNKNKFGSNNKFGSQETFGSLDKATHRGSDNFRSSNRQSIKDSINLAKARPKALFDVPKDVKKFLVNSLKTHGKDEIWSAYEEAAKKTSNRYDELEIISMAAHNFLPNFGLCSRVIDDVSSVLPDFQPTTYLDYGSSFGSSSLAVKEKFKSIDKFSWIEPCPNTAEFALELLQTSYEDIKIDQFDDTEPYLENGNQFDLITVNFALNKLLPKKFSKLFLPEKIKTVLKKINKLLKENGVLVIVERSGDQLRAVSNDFFIQLLREYLVKTCKLQVVAPCTHSLDCPMFSVNKHKKWRGRVCSFEQVTEILNKDYLNVHEEKMRAPENKIKNFYTYVVVRKGPVERDIGTCRIIEPPIKADKHVYLPLCKISGEYERKVVTISKNTHAGYRSARKAVKGGIWIYE